MAGEWYYSRAGTKTGPVTKEQVKLLANSAQLSPDDLLWKTGMSAWTPAHRFKGLFNPSPFENPAHSPTTAASPNLNGNTCGAEASTSPPNPTPAIALKSKPANIDEQPPQAPEPASSNPPATPAERPISLIDQRAELVSTTLPQAYRQLGRHLHKAGKFRADFPDLFRHLDRLLISIETLRSRLPDHNSSDTSSNNDAAKLQIQYQGLEARLAGFLEQLGQSAFEKQGTASGPTEFTGPIMTSRAQLETLDAAIQRLSQPKRSRAGRYRKILYGGIVTGVATLIVLLVYFLTRSANAPVESKPHSESGMATSAGTPARPA